MLILCLVVTAVASYLIGSINGAIITSKYFYKKDIREYGSKNPGLTNFYRVFGKGGALLVILIDILKTVIPLLIGHFLFGLLVGQSLLGREYAGLFVMFGHAYPVYYGFKGGKTVMAVGVITCFIDWRAALLGWGMFILITLLFRYVSLGAMIGVLAYPAAILAFQLGGPVEFVVALLSALFLIYRHKENIVRLIHGQESRFRFKKS